MNMDLESLINAKLEGEITPEQHARLEALLRDDWQARRRYLELADQHARLLRQPEVSTGRLGQAPLITPSSSWRYWPGQGSRPTKRRRPTAWRP